MRGLSPVHRLRGQSCYDRKNAPFSGSTVITSVRNVGMAVRGLREALRIARVRGLLERVNSLAFGHLVHDSCSID